MATLGILRSLSEYHRQLKAEQLELGAETSIRTLARLKFLDEFFDNMNAGKDFTLDGWK